MADDGPPEREVKDFQFHHLAKIRVFEEKDDLPANRVDLVTCSNKYGLIFVGGEIGFKVYEMNKIVERSTEEGVRVSKIIDNMPEWLTVSTPSAPSHLAVCRNGTMLAACVHKNGHPFMELYDIKSLARQPPASPVLNISLSTASDVTVADVAWNPGADFSTSVAVGMSDGSVSLYDVKDKKLKIMASVPKSTGATCLCWSPKGKQLVIGKSDGSLAQYDQSLTKKKDIACPTIFDGKPVTVVDVFWESTHIFLASFEPKDNENHEEQPHVVLIVSKKDAPVTYTDFEDPCFGGGEERVSKLYMRVMIEWDVILIASTNAVEVAVLGRHEEDKTKWERYSLDDDARAETQLTANYSETYPLGLAVNRTAQQSIPIGDDKTHPASPILLMLSTDGLLACFYIMNLKPGVPSMVSAAEPLSRELQSDVEGTPLNSKTPAASHPTPSSVSRSLFQEKPVAEKAGVRAVGTVLDDGSQSFNLGQPLGQSTPAVTQTKYMFGGPGFGKPAGGVTPQAESVPLDLEKAQSSGKASGTPTKFAAPTSSVTSAESASLKGGPSAFSFAAKQTAATSATTFCSSESSAFVTAAAVSPSNTTPTSAFGRTAPTLTSGMTTSVSTSAAMAPGSASATVAPTSASGVMASASAFSVASPISAFGTTTPKPMFGSKSTGSLIGSTKTVPAFGTSVTSAFTAMTSGMATTNRTGLSPSQSASKTPTTKPLSKTVPAFSAKTPGKENEGPVRASSQSNFSMASLCSSVSSSPKPAHTTDFVAIGTPSSKPTSTTALPVLLATQQPKPVIAQPSHVAEQQPRGLQQTAQSHAGSAKKTQSPGMLNTVTPPGSRTNTSLRYELSTVKSSKDRAKELLQKGLQEEMLKFQMQIDDLRHDAQILPELFLQKDELKSLVKNTDMMKQYVSDITENTKAISQEINELKSACVDSFVTITECQLKEEKLREGNHKAYTLNRKLDPVSARQLREINRQFQSLIANVADVDNKLNDEWESYQSKSHRKRMMPNPTSDTIYHTLSASRKVIQDEARNLEILETQMMKMRLNSLISQNPSRSRNESTRLDLSNCMNNNSRVDEPTEVSNVSRSSQNKPLQSLIMKVLPDPEGVSPSKSERKNISPGSGILPQNASDAKHFWVRTRQRPATSLGARSGQTQARVAQYSSPESSPMGYDFSQSIRMQQQQTLASLMNVGAGQPPIGGALASALLSVEDESEEGQTVMKYLERRLYLSEEQESYANVGVEDISSAGSSPEVQTTTVNLGNQRQTALNPSAGNLFSFKSQAQGGATAVFNFSKSPMTNVPAFSFTKTVQKNPSLGYNFGDSSSFLGSGTTERSFQFTGISTESKEKGTQKLGGGSFWSVVNTEHKPQESSWSPAEETKAHNTASSQQKSASLEFGTEVNPSLGFKVNLSDQAASEADESSGVAQQSSSNTAPRAGKSTTTETASLTGQQASGASYQEVSSDQPSLFKFSASTVPLFGKSAKLEEREQLASETNAEVVTDDSSTLYGQRNETSESAPGLTTADKVTTDVPATAEQLTSTAEGSSLTATSSDSPAPSGEGTKPTLVQRASSSESSAGSVTSSSSADAISSSPLMFGQTATTAATTSTPSLFGQTATTAATSSTPSIFGQTVTAAATSSTPSAFGQTAKPAATPSTPSIFGQAATTAATSSTPSILGQAITAAATSSTPSVFDQAVTTAATSNTPSGFCGTAATTATSSTPSIFGQTATTAATSSSPSIIGQTVTAAATSSTPSAFGQTTSSAATSSTPSTFGQTTSTAATSSTSSAFGQTSTAATSSTPSIFGQTITTSATSSTPSIFGQTVTTPATSSTPSLFGQTATTAATSSTSSIFGQTVTTAATSSTSSIFGQTVTTAATSSTPSLFGQTATTAATSSTPSLFGQTATTAATSSTPSLFGQTATTAATSSTPSLFGQTAPATNSNSGGSFTFGGFGQQQSNFGGQTVFGQQQQGGSLFGNKAGDGTPSFGSSSVFSLATTSSNMFGQSSTTPATTTTATSSSGSLFGGSGGGLFGLGGKASAENANKNVFGGTATFGSQSHDNSLFGGSGSSGFGTVKTSVNVVGSFSANSGSIATAGFGGFQTSEKSAFGASPGFGGTAQLSGSSTFGSAPSFGSPPAFGGSQPTFGSPPVFGSQPAFGSPPVFGSGVGSVFGTAGAASSNQQSAGFASFASAASPTFGALAQGSGSGAGFGALASQQSGPDFNNGSAAGGFGSANLGSSSFSPQSPASSSSFTAYRG